MSSQLLRQLIKTTKCSVPIAEKSDLQHSFSYDSTTHMIQLVGNHPQMKINYDFASAPEAFNILLSEIKAQDSTVDEENFEYDEKHLRWCINANLLEKLNKSVSSSSGNGIGVSKTKLRSVPLLSPSTLFRTANSQASVPQTHSTDKPIKVDNSIDEKVLSKISYHVLTSAKLPTITAQLEGYGYKVKCDVTEPGKNKIIIDDKRDNSIHVTIETSKIGDAVNVDISENDNQAERAEKMKAFARCNKILFNEAMKESNGDQRLVIELVEADNIHEIAEAASACLKIGLPIELADKWIVQENEFMQILKALDKKSYEQYNAALAEQKVVCDMGCGA